MCESQILVTTAKPNLTVCKTHKRLIGQAEICSSCLCDTLLGLQLGGFDGVVMTLAAVTAMVPPLEQLTPKKPEPISTDISARARLGVMGTMQAVTQILYATFAAAQPQWKAGNHTAHQVISRM